MLSYMDKLRGLSGMPGQSTYNKFGGMKVQSLNPKKNGGVSLTIIGSFIATGSTRTFPLPAKAAVGDLILGAGSDNGFANLTTMASNGWTTDHVTNPNDTNQHTVAWKLLTAADIAAGNVAGQGWNSTSSSGQDPVFVVYRGPKSAVVKQWVLTNGATDTLSYAGYAKSARHMAAATYQYNGGNPVSPTVTGTKWTLEANTPSGSSYSALEDTTTYAGEAYTWQFPSWNPATGAAIEVLSG